MGTVYKFPGTKPDEPEAEEQSIADWLRSVAEETDEHTINAIVILLDDSGIAKSDSARYLNLDEYVGALEITKQSTIYNSMFEDE